MEGVKYQKGVFELRSSYLAELRIIQKANQRADVVAAVHVTEKTNGMRPVDQGTFALTFCQCGQKAGFDIRRFVDARWYSLCQ